MKVKLALLLLVPVIALRAQEPRKPPAPNERTRVEGYTTWSDYAGSPDSMQYSALAQINKTNVTELQPVWFYPVPGDPERLVFNPLIVDAVMYVAGPQGVVVALDAATPLHRKQGKIEAQGYHVFALKGQ